MTFILQKNELIKIARLIKEGKILVLPTDTVYGLTLSLEKSENSDLIYQIKQRSENKPLAIVVSNLPMAENIGYFDQNTISLLKKYPPGKITLVVLKKPNVLSLFNKIRSVGIRITADKWLQGLINITGPLLMTSWNVSGHSPFNSPYQKDINNLIFAIVDGGFLSNKPSLVFDSINKKWIRF